MFNLQSAFDDFAPCIEVRDPVIDSDFITAFLLPHFHDIPREELAAKLAEIIKSERAKPVSGPRRRDFVP